MSPTAEYLTLLAVAIGLTFVVGRLLVTAGEPFLQEVFQDRSVTRSVNLLLSVLFHLITLGVLAIISVVDLDLGDPLQTLVAKLGVVLLVLGVAYGVSMLVLIRVRERRQADTIAEHVQERMAERDGPPPPPAATAPAEAPAASLPPGVRPPAAQPAVQPTTQPAASAERPRGPSSGHRWFPRPRP